VAGALSERTRLGAPVKQGSSNSVKRDMKQGVLCGCATEVWAQTATVQYPLSVRVTLSHVPWRGCLVGMGPAECTVAFGLGVVIPSGATVGAAGRAGGGGEVDVCAAV
jgi:hypothetical protein